MEGWDVVETRTLWGGMGWDIGLQCLPSDGSSSTEASEKWNM